MAVLTQAGIKFSATDVIENREWIFPTGTQWIFCQSAAPTGWTKDTTYDDRALRVVSGTGGGNDGTQPFTTVCNSSFAFAGTLETTTASQPNGLLSSAIASHIHDQPGRFTVTANPATYNPDGAFTGWSGGDLSRTTGWTRYTGDVGGPTAQVSPHNHPVTASAPINKTFPLGVYYVDVILCSFDG